MFFNNFHHHQQLPPMKKRTKVLLILSYSLLLLTSIIPVTESTREIGIPHNKKWSPISPRDIVKASCMKTINPTFCFEILSPIPLEKPITQYKIIETAINRTIRIVESSHSEISNIISSPSLNSCAASALHDCLELQEQTIYELEEAVEALQNFPAKGSIFRQAGVVNNLLSAAMTNQNTCLDGFSGLNCNRIAIHRYLGTQLIPIYSMVSNCLAMVKDMADKDQVGRKKSNKPELMISGHLLPEFGKMEDGFPLWLTGVDRKIFRSDRIRPDLIVAGDGSGDCRTISEGVRMAVNSSSVRFVIRIKAGIYRENVEISRRKTNVMFVGEGRDRTVITGNRSVADGFTTFNSATLAVSGDGFIARGLSIINTAGPSKHQAVALRVNANHAAFYGCKIAAYQDSLYAHSLRQFYRDCNIYGTVDFIFGNAAVVFQNCLILARKPNPGQTNMITAQGRLNQNQNTGISIQNCTITASPDLVNRTSVFSTYLGRPWKVHSRTMVMESFLGNLVHPQGWHMWDEFTNVSAVEYVEYKNRGPGSNTAHRVKWPGFRANVTREQAMVFTVGEFIGDDHWLQSLGFPYYNGFVPGFN